jgi:hypothetical protein
MTKLAITCESWKPMEKNTLKGFASVNIGNLALQIHDVAVHQKDGRMWAALPARPWIKDGALVVDETGKPQYSPVLEFDRREVRDAFSAAVIRAVRERFPGALDARETAP